MSCNGCRVLRKGCSESCILRPCLQWIDTAEAQGHATVFVAKFFGRAGLISFISAVSEAQRPALFQSLLFEAAGRTVNPVNGAVGLLGTGNWHVCQAAVETVLRGGALKPIPGLLGGESEPDDTSECIDILKIQDQKRRRVAEEPAADLDLSLTAGLAWKRRLGSPSMNSEESVTASEYTDTLKIQDKKRRRVAEEPAADLDLNLTAGMAEKRRLGSPSLNSEESVTTTGGDQPAASDIKLLKLFD